MSSTPYVVKRASRSRFLSVRGLRYHVLEWADASLVTPERPPLVMLHGWMDVAASFQFVVDALTVERHVIAIDWRGFGLSDAPAADCYWFPDYLGDLEGVLDAVFTPDQPVDLLGHSMGGNVAMIYAGVRPERVRKLVNLEGFGLPESKPHHAPKRYAQWLDELKQPVQLRTYDSVDDVAARLRKTNPLLSADRASWLASHWSRCRDDGQWEILGDPAHKRTNPVLYQKAEVLECWQRISAPVMWVEGDQTDVSKWWGNRYPREDFESRLKVVGKLEKHLLSPAGHMLHHDQPEELAGRLERFFGVIPLSVRAEVSKPS
ncbi:MAG: alpha/beta hydrolase [Betaproteobacteria bacterium]|nr:MAG: alpha/beta hydrolase [Betaproteobacteria bacterium]